MPNPPQFSAEQSPSEILNRAGEWLALELGNGFGWVKSRQSVSRARRGRIEEIRLQPSRWNRAGFGTWATVRVTVRSKELAAWRRSHAEATLLAHNPDLLWTNEFINVDKGLYFVELSGHREPESGGVRVLSLVELAEGARAAILPVLEHFDSPRAVAENLPDNWLVLSAPLVEWAISLNDLPSARRIAERIMRVSPQAAGVFEGGRASYQAGRRPAFPLGEEAVGWMAARHGLFPTNEPLPWTLPPASEEQRLIASGRALAERLRSELRHFQSTRPGGLHDEQLNELLALVNQWVAALTHQPRSSPPPNQALSHLVREFGIQEAALGRDLIRFNDLVGRAS